MQELYSQKDIASLNAQIKKRYLVLAIILCLLLALVIWSVVIRTEWLTMVAVSLMGAVCVFVIEMFILPLIRYRRLMLTAFQGRTHTETMEYAHTEPEISMVDGVACRSLVFLGAPEKHGVREIQYYWDVHKPLPDFAPGEKVTLKYSGKNILAWQRAPLTEAQ